MTTPIKIEKGIPVPSKGKLRRQLERLKPGDSFKFEGMHITAIYASARKTKTLPAIKITTRKVNEDGWNGVRCWRVE